MFDRNYTCGDNLHVYKALSFSLLTNTDLQFYIENNETCL